MRYPTKCLSCLCLAIAICTTSATAWAQDKPKWPSCPDQLAQNTQHANNLALDRANKEYALAKAQVEVQQWRQQAASLQRQIDEMKKVEPKEEKP